MLKILINAYACSPDMGSEPGMAWNWCVNLAKHCELHIITEGEFKDKIEQVLPSLPQGKNMHFYYNELAPEIRKMCWNQGDWRFYKHYKVWQKKTLEIAQKIIKNHKIDILHQLNMIGFREPGYLWKIGNIPFVWGPVDAKESFPISYLRYAPFKTKFFIYLKNLITKWQLKYDRRVRKAIMSSSAIFSASSNSQKTFKKYYGKETILLNETGCSLVNNSLKKEKNKEFMDVLWVGKLDFRKQLTLAIKSLSKSQNTKIKLHIIGSGDNTQFINLSKKYNIDKQCFWYGTLPHSEVQKMMQKSDLLFFTSVAEGTPHVVLEAISNNLPILCIDTCGQGDSVNEKVGIKIKLTDIEQSAIDFAKQLNRLFLDKNLLNEFSINCSERQIELSWENKVKKMINIYNHILEDSFLN